MRKSTLLGLSTLALSILALSASSLAQEKGSIGFAAEVAVDGFFSPKLTQMTVSEVFADSAAAAAGILAGQKIVSIEGCDIPGCPASKAKQLMHKEPGEMLPLLVEGADGKQTLIKIQLK